MLNKNIVHLIDKIFWNMGFKAETQADKVMLFTLIISIISKILIISIKLIMHIIYRFVRILDWRTTCGRTGGH